MGIAMAISDAATTKIRNTRTAPSTAPFCCAKLTRLRFTPFSISSIDISMTSTLRRTTMPSRPSANSATLSARSICILSTFPRIHADDRDRCHDGRDQQYGSELEVEPVLVQKRDRERLDAEYVGAGFVRHAVDAVPERQHQRDDEQREARDAGEQQGRIAAREGKVAGVEQHDDVHHEHHYGADIDQHLEHGDHVYTEQAVDAAER